MTQQAARSSFSGFREAVVTQQAVRSSFSGVRKPAVTQQAVRSDTTVTRRESFARESAHSPKLHFCEMEGRCRGKASVLASHSCYLVFR